MQEGALWCSETLKQEAGRREVDGSKSRLDHAVAPSFRLERSAIEDTWRVA